MINDIQLTPTSNGKQDWVFSTNDVSNVIGNQQLVSACKHAILLTEDELAQEIYQDKGCPVNRYAILPMTQHTETLITESITTACKEVNGVKDAHAEIVQDETIGTALSNVTITNENGVEVRII